MTILLIGPHNWVNQLTRDLTDRTYSSTGTAVEVVTHTRQLYGRKRDYIEVIMLGQGYTPNDDQEQAIRYAQHINLMNMRPEPARYPPLVTPPTNRSELNALLRRALFQALKGVEKDDGHRYDVPASDLVEYRTVILQLIKVIRPDFDPDSPPQSAHEIRAIVDEIDPNLESATTDEEANEILNRIVDDTQPAIPPTISIDPPMTLKQFLEDELKADGRPSLDNGI